MHRPDEDRRSGRPQGAPDRVEPAPFLHQSSHLCGGGGFGHSHQAIVDRHDRDQRERPVGDQDNRPQSPAPVAGRIPFGKSQQAAEDVKAGLHREAAFVGRLPLGEQRAVVETEPCGMFGNIDIDSSAGEHRRRNQSRLTSENDDVSVFYRSRYYPAETWPGDLKEGRQLPPNRFWCPAIDKQ